MGVSYFFRKSPKIKDFPQPFEDRHCPGGVLCRVVVFCMDGLVVFSFQYILLVILVWYMMMMIMGGSSSSK